MPEKLKHLRNLLRVWNKETFGDIDNKIEILGEEMEKNINMETNSPDESLLARRSALLGQLDLWYKR